MTINSQAKKWKLHAMVYNARKMIVTPILSVENFYLIIAKPQLKLSHSPTLEAAYCCNQEGGIIQSLQPGIYGLSNHLLDTPWEKVTRGKEKFSTLVSELQNGSLSQEKCEEQLLNLLCDDTRSVMCQLNNNNYYMHTFFVLM